MSTLETIVMVAMLAVPPIAYLRHRMLRPKMVPLSTFLFSCIAVYALILLRTVLIETRLDAELAAFDLDGDGFFAGPEIHPAQQLAMDRVVQDTGRTFAPFTGAVFAPMYVGLAFTATAAVLEVRARLVRLRKKRD